MSTNNMHQEIRDAVGKMCLKFDNKYWQNCDEKDLYPTEFVNELTISGFLASLIPEKYGGAGLPLSAGAVILEEIHKSGGNAAACHAQMYTMGTILRHGSEKQKSNFLPKIASGDLRLQAFGVTEPNSGSDTLSLKTNAVFNGEKYIINGQKIWTSRAEHSDLLLLLARTKPLEEVKKKTEGLSVFLIDMRDHIGNSLTIKPVKTMMNHSTTEIFFENLSVSPDNLIGDCNDGFKYILSGMNAERILISAECIGDAKWFLKMATDYSKDRKVFNRPIGKNQGIQFPIAKAYSKMRAAELMLWSAINLFDEGKNPGEEANLAKLLCSEASWEAAEMCIQTYGGFGFAKEYDIERKYREARLYQVAPVSTNLILSFIAEHVLNLPRSY
mgnify:FL=1